MIRKPAQRNTSLRRQYEFLPGVLQSGASALLCRSQPASRDLRRSLPGVPKRLHRVRHNALTRLSDREYQTFGFPNP